MITYDRLWQTMKQRGVSQYDLYTHYNVNRSQLNIKILILIRKASPDGAACFMIYKERNHKTSLI